MTRKRYWKSLEEYRGDAQLAEQAKDEFPAPLDLSVSRRTFIEAAGLSAIGLVVNGCRAPEQKIVPYVKQPVDLTPGVANWYASTCGGCSAACGTLVRVCDGRPVKLEGNPEHPLTRGGLCAAAHAELFNLYDSKRLRQPLIKGQPAAWEDVDRQVIQKLSEIRNSGGKVRLLTPFIISPTTKNACEIFETRNAETRHVEYQPISTSAIIAAHERTHNFAGSPIYRFENVKLTVSFAADFLGTWGSTVQQMRGYSRSRDLRDGRRERARHIHYESHLSLTGSNADQRIMIAPAEGFEALLQLARLIGEKTGTGSIFSTFEPARLSDDAGKAVRRSADELYNHRGASLVVCGWNDVDAQAAVNFINDALGNYGKTIELIPASPGSGDQQMVELVREMNEGQVDALIMAGVNPVYSYYDSESFRRGLEKVPLRIWLGPRPDETSPMADFACPTPHFLETWDDAMPARGVYSLAQPVIAPLFRTRAWQQSLLKWSGDDRDYYRFLRDQWRERVFPLQTQFAKFDEFWDRSLHDGVFTAEAAPGSPPTFNEQGLNVAAERLSSRSREAAGKQTLVLYQNVALRDGRGAGNPWLHELPDPLTRITWDNYLNVAPKFAGKMQLTEGDVVRVSKGGKSIELPVHVQPGQDENCLSIALGYGLSGIGANAYPFVGFAGGCFQYESSGVSVEKTGAVIEFAKTQTHDSHEGRGIIREMSLASLLGAPHGEEVSHDAGHHVQSIWPGHEYAEHKWGMVIDLDACLGCSACLLSCQVENNVPVVGKDEVRRRREMHWIRIDRYYEGDPDDPEVSFQPVMCVHCDNASCESVCPVLATIHSGDGLNMQVYNRCVGTRYCANNCAFKVRRFNWFNYPHDDALANLALNPDVTVRSRGVMEKCSFCIQRIEEARIRARNENRPIRDGEIQTACQQSCPAGAISFGNLLDPESRVARLKRDRRNYSMIEELNLQPALSYLAKVSDDGGEA